MVVFVCDVQTAAKIIHSRHKTLNIGLKYKAVIKLMDLSLIEDA